MTIPVLPLERKATHSLCQEKSDIFAMFSKIENKLIPKFGLIGVPLYSRKILSIHQRIHPPSIYKWQK